MPGSIPPFTATSTVDRSRSPPLRPPRLRPPSRSSSVATDLNAANQASGSGIWADTTLTSFYDPSQEKFPPAVYRDYVRASFVNMEKGSTEAITPAREMSSPTLGMGDGMPPMQYGDREKKSSETNGRRSRSGSSSSHPGVDRSMLRTVFLVLSCAGAMIINVSGPMSALWG